MASGAAGANGVGPTCQTDPAVCQSGGCWMTDTATAYADSGSATAKVVAFNEYNPLPGGFDLAACGPTRGSCSAGLRRGPFDANSPFQGQCSGSSPTPGVNVTVYCKTVVYDSQPPANAEFQSAGGPPVSTNPGGGGGGGGARNASCNATASKACTTGPVVCPSGGCHVLYKLSASASSGRSAAKVVLFNQYNPLPGGFRTLTCRSATHRCSAKVTVGPFDQYSPFQARCLWTGPRHARRVRVGCSVSIVS